MGNVGRPRALDKKKLDTILKVIRMGGSRRCAAMQVGCALTTIANEAAANQRFMDGLKKAESDCELLHIARVSAGGLGWQSSAWMLERKFPKRWAAKKQPDVAVITNGGNVPTVTQVAEALDRWRKQEAAAHKITPITSAAK